MNDSDERGSALMKTRDFSFLMGLLAGIPMGIGFLAIACVIAQ
jgi:hypothetical protein